MTNEKKLDSILEKISKIDNDLSTFKNHTENNFDKIDKKLSTFESKLNKIEKRLDSTFKQTAKLTEFRNEVNTKLDDIKDNIDYLTIKAAVNEREIFKIKQKQA